MSEPQPQSDAMPALEQIGDRYQLVGEIARGGMGVILRGRDADLGRDLAIKLLLEKHANRPEVVRRFIEEAQIGGQLQHPGVVPVYDIGRFGDRPYFTMKLVKGHTLAALLAKQNVGPVCNRPETTTVGYKPAPKDLWRFLRIALQVAQTLAYAHAKGVIHRDLRPANIMVGAFGEVQVMDWGLAKVLGEGGVADEEKARRGRKSPEEGTLIRTARSTGSAGTFGTDTEAGSLMGAPAYIPPEQATGNVDLPDQRADVFGLGAILCEILTGKPPYVGQSEEEVRRKAANGDLADAHARLDASGADVELIALIRACLSPEMSGRPGDAQAVAEALSAYLDELQERRHIAELAEAWAKARAEEAKRRRLTLALAGTVLLAVTLIGCGWLWVKADRDARMAQVTRHVNEALNQATALREQAKAAPSGGAALSAQAREQAQRALALVENGPADAALTAQVRQLQAELDEEEKDRLVANPVYKITEPHVDWLEAVAERIQKTEGWTRELRATRKEKDAAKRRQLLEKLAESADEERLALVEWCKVKKLHHTAAGLYVSAFAAAPKLAENLKIAHRYNAACSSALAAAGQGEDTARLDAKERARLRKQALDWLKADLTAWGKLLDSGRPQDRPFLVQTLRHWQQDSNLAGLRDAASLAKLPADEQKACAQLWADVAALLKKAETTPAQKETPR